MILLYGASGFTGRMIADELARQGVPMILAGRDAGTLRPLPGGAIRFFAVDDAAAALDAGLADVSVVLNAAGPFHRTARLLATACVARGVHYLDLAGEVEEHESVHTLDEAARAAGAMVLPGVGFGCVPTELAAVEAVRRLGGHAERLVLAYDAVGGASRGTLESMLPSIHHSGVQREGGELVATRPGVVRRRLDLGGGEVEVVTNPWRADVVAAFASTGTPAIETLATFPLAARLLMRWPRFTRSSVGRRVVAKAIRDARNPTAAQLAAGHTRVLATASDGARVVDIRLRGPEAYVFTARTAVAITRAVIAGAARPGYATPSMVLPWAGLLAITGVEEVAS